MEVDGAFKTCLNSEWGAAALKEGCPTDLVLRANYESRGGFGGLKTIGYCWNFEKV